MFYLFYFTQVVDKHIHSCKYLKKDECESQMNFQQVNQMHVSIKYDEKIEGQERKFKIQKVAQNDDQTYQELIQQYSMTFFQIQRQIAIFLFQKKKNYKGIHFIFITESRPKLYRSELDEQDAERRMILQLDLFYDLFLYLLLHFSGKHGVNFNKKFFGEPQGCLRVTKIYILPNSLFRLLNDNATGTRNQKNKYKIHFIQGINIDSLAIFFFIPKLKVKLFFYLQIRVLVILILQNIGINDQKFYIHNTLLDVLSTSSNFLIQISITSLVNALKKIILISSVILGSQL
ncbi:hypothetical protein pb186bvf_007193 [Paramecium bursaria]